MNLIYRIPSRREVSTYLSACVVLITTIRAPDALGQGTYADSAQAVARQSLLALIRADYSFVAEHTNPAELRRTRMAFDSVFAADSSNYAVARLFDVDSPTRLRGLTDSQFTARLLAFWAAATGSDRQFAEIRDLDIVGSVLRGSDTVLVVYRWRFATEPIVSGSYRVEPTIRCGKEWCSQMAANFSSILATLRSPPRSAKPPMVPKG